MSQTIESWTHHRARVASLSRSRAHDDPELAGAKQSLKAAKMADYIERALATAPPLTEEQRLRIARLLQGGASA